MTVLLGRRIRPPKTIRAACWVFIAIWGANIESYALAVGQQEEDGSGLTRIALGSTSGEAGTSVVVPISFTPADNAKVGFLKLELTFVSRNLKFTQLEKGFAAEAGSVELKTRLEEKKNDQGLETSNLIIETSFSTAAVPPTGIPSGLLAYLNFQINPTAGAASITLRTSAEGKELGTNKPPENLRIADGRVETLAAGSVPLAICFFFNH